MSSRRYIRRPVSIPEDDTASFSSDDDNSTIKTSSIAPPSRYSTSKWPRFSQISISPSPRVSAINGPRGTFIENENDGEIEYYTRDPKTFTCLKAFVVILSIVVILLTVVIIYLTALSTNDGCFHNTYKDVVTPRDLKNPDVFDDLTPNEYKAVYEYLIYGQELNLTRFDYAAVNSDYIYSIELHTPPKEDVIKYLDLGKSMPPREAKVTIICGSKNPPVIENYVISSTLNPNHIRPFDDTVSQLNDRVRYLMKPLDKVDKMFLYSHIIRNITEQLNPVLIAKYNLSYHNCTTREDCLQIELFQDFSKNGVSVRYTWAWMFSNTVGLVNYPLGLGFLIDHTSSNVCDWRVEQISYNKQLFHNISEFNDAVNHTNGRVSKIPMFQHSQYQNHSADKPIQGPRLAEPDGKRFKIQGQHVKYNKWDLHLSTSPSQGLKLYNVKFDGNRIAYEISPQQFISEQGGVGTFFGESKQELVKGIDCPDTAVFLDVDTFVNSGSVETVKNGICVFEMNGGVPLQRHYSNSWDDSFQFYYGRVDYFIVIRTIACVGKYDYILDYMFRPSGAVEVKIWTTGYNNAGTTGADIVNSKRAVPEFQSEVHRFNFKVDLDIDGTLNKFSTVTYEQTNEVIENKNTKTLGLRYGTFTNESMNHVLHGNEDRYYIFHSSNNKSRTALDKGYQIINNSPVPEVFTKTQRMPNMVNYPLIVTKQKDNETIAVMSRLNAAQGLFTAESFIDGDSLMDTDLVIWITMGYSHLLTKEDLPFISTTQNVCSFSILPFNYFTEYTTVEEDGVVLRQSSRDSDSSDLR